MDFTEFLWDILKQCTDYRTLVAALNIVFDALKQCRINAVVSFRYHSSDVVVSLISYYSCMKTTSPQLPALFEMRNQKISCCRDSRR